MVEAAFQDGYYYMAGLSLQSHLELLHLTRIVSEAETEASLYS
jgi:hypothetical protein